MEQPSRNRVVKTIDEVFAAGLNVFTTGRKVSASPTMGELLNLSTLIIEFPSEFADHAGLVDNSRNHAMLQTILREMGLAEMQKIIFRGSIEEGCSNAEPNEQGQSPLSDDEVPF